MAKMNPPKWADRFLLRVKNRQFPGQLIATHRRQQGGRAATDFDELSPREVHFM